MSDSTIDDLIHRLIPYQISSYIITFTTSITTTQIQTFHPFPRLPTELRLKIWSHYQSATQPRFIDIHRSRTSYLPRDPGLAACTGSSHIFYNRQAIPTILHINSEAHALGLSIFKCGLNTSISVPKHEPRFRDLEHPEYIPCPCESKIREQNKDIEGFLYWNPDRDVLVQRPFSSPFPGSKGEAYDAQRQLSRLSKAAMIYSPNNDLSFTNVRWAVVEQHTNNPFGGAGRLLFEGMECVFLFVDRSLFEETRWHPPAIYFDRKSWKEGTRTNSEDIWRDYKKAAKRYWVGRDGRGGEGPDLMVVHYFQEVVNEIERRTRV